MYRGDVDAFNRHFPPSCVIVHGLGPTECFIVCFNYVPHGTRVEGSKLDIGWPVRDKEVLLLDEAGSEVPVGEVGEIHVRSRHIALGYWRDADRTRAAFLQDPDDPEVRTYRTGDLGVRASDGCFTHVGRRDFQVKIRGFRIDVTEIEVALRAIDGVRDAVVVGREDKVGEKRLVAYFVPASRPAVSATHIRRGLAKVVPEYMIPSAIVCLDALPQTPNGKTDRLRLPAPSHERPNLETVFSAPTTETERDLLHIWSEILAIDDIGIHDNFFELGGDSIGVARVVARVWETFNVEVPLGKAIEASTVAALAKLIRDSAPAAIDETLRGLAGRGENREMAERR
jgi:acyl carrier protein